MARDGDQFVFECCARVQSSPSLHRSACFPLLQATGFRSVGHLRPKAMWSTSNHSLYLRPVHLRANALLIRGRRLPSGLAFESVAIGFLNQDRTVTFSVFRSFTSRPGRSWSSPMKGPLCPFTMPEGRTPRVPAFCLPSLLADADSLDQCRIDLWRTVPRLSYFNLVPPPMARYALRAPQSFLIYLINPVGRWRYRSLSTAWASHFHAKTPLWARSPW